MTDTRGIRMLKNQKGELSSTYWKFTQAVVSGTTVVDEDTMIFAIEARGAVQWVRGGVSSEINDGVIGDFSGTFPADDSDTDELLLEKFEINGEPVKPQQK